jgi:hypothetical protein
MKMHKTNNLLADLTRVLHELERADLALPRDVRLVIDVDPQDFL